VHQASIPVDLGVDDLAAGSLFQKPDEDLLRIETHHRLMNTFAILGGLLQQECRAAGSSHQVALDRSVRMIMAHSALHRCLALVTQHRQVALDAFVAELSKCLSEAVLKPMGISCEVRTDEGSMAAAHAERLGLVLCELVINAAKHGVAYRETGVVRIKVARRGQFWCCTVADNGDGLAERDSSAGLGTQIVEILVRRLSGRMRVRSTAQGTIITLLIPSAADSGP
jgi:two-component sensor histidine kinase